MVLKLKRQLTFYFAIFSLLWIAVLYQNCAPPQNLQSQVETPQENPDDSRIVRALGAHLSDGYSMEGTCGSLENYVCESTHEGADLVESSDVVRECFDLDGEQICVQVLENSKKGAPRSHYVCYIATVEYRGAFPLQGSGDSLQEAFNRTNDMCISQFLAASR